MEEEKRKDIEEEKRKLKGKRGRLFEEKRRYRCLKMVKVY